MARIVMKFGGTSMAGIERIRHVAALVKREADARQPGRGRGFCHGRRDRPARAALPGSAPLYDPREYDVVVASGEQVTSGLLAITLSGMGVNARSYMGWQLPIRASGHSSALIDHIEADVLEGVFAKGGIAVIPGFQGVTVEGDLATLGRGGSDTSAVALAVGGQGRPLRHLYRRRRRLHDRPAHRPAGTKLSAITYEEMLELASRRRQGPADPLGRPCHALQYGASGPFILRGQARHAHRRR